MFCFDTTPPHHPTSRRPVRRFQASYPHPSRPGSLLGDSKIVAGGVYACQLLPFNEKYPIPRLSTHAPTLSSLEHARPARLWP